MNRSKMSAEPALGVAGFALLVGLDLVVGEDQEAVCGDSGNQGRGGVVWGDRVARGAGEARAGVLFAPGFQHRRGDALDPRLRV